MVGKVINFIVLFGGLGFLLRKTILKYFEERIALTKKELDRASQEKEEGQRRREEIVRRYQRLDEELAKIRKDSLRQAEERKKPGRKWIGSTKNTCGRSKNTRPRWL